MSPPQAGCGEGLRGVRDTDVAVSRAERPRRRRPAKREAGPRTGGHGCGGRPRGPVTGTQWSPVSDPGPTPSLRPSLPPNSPRTPALRLVPWTRPARSPPVPTARPGLLVACRGVETETCRETRTGCPTSRSHEQPPRADAVRTWSTGPQWGDTSQAPAGGTARHTHLASLNRAGRGHTTRPSPF